MGKIKVYDVKLKVQHNPDGDTCYKPAYPRFLIIADNPKDAKTRALSAFTGDNIDEMKFTIVETSLMKVDRIFNAKNQN